MSTELLMWVDEQKVGLNSSTQAKKENLVG